MTSIRCLGQSDLEVQPVVFGAWAIGGWYWGGSDDALAIEAIRASVEAGVTAIDTAPMYGCGHSEEVVGRAIRGRREAVTVMTKVGLRWDCDDGEHFFDDWGADGSPMRVFRNLSAQSVRLEVERSLTRLGIDEIDLLQCHWPDPSTEVEETMDALASLVSEGKVRAVGVSNFSPDLLERSQRELARHGLTLASNQPRYSLLDREIEDEVLPWCLSSRVGVVVYSPLEQGLLTGKVSVDRVFADDDGRAHDPAFSTENRQRVLDAIDATSDIAATHAATPAQLALAWCFHQEGVTAAIAGARSPEQARENAAAAAVRLSEEEISTLTRCFAAVKLER